MKKPGFINVPASKLVLLLISVFLHGCALPGFMRVDELVDYSKGGVTTEKHILGYRPVVESEPTLKIPGSEARLTPINDAEIQRQINAARVADLPINVKALIGVSPPYTMGPGDVVGIIVYDHPELLPNAGAVINQQADPTGVNVAPGFIISANGDISFPYAGRVKLAGLTEIEASNLITNTIAKYIRDPQVTVRIQSFRSRRAYVEGDVRTPGMQIFTDVPMTLAEAISRAGGITSAGDRSFITLTRAGVTVRIDMQQLEERGQNLTSIPLKNGDVVNVKNREESKIYVMGEVVRPSALLMRNGRLSLNEALGEAGGPNLSTSNTGQVYVIRNDESGSPIVYHLNAKNPTALALAERFALVPRDVVYIDPVPLVLWTRLVSLVLPSAQVVNLTK